MESEMTDRELPEKGARLAQETAKLPAGAVLPWIEASTEVERFSHVRCNDKCACHYLASWKIMPTV